MADIKKLMKKPSVVAKLAEMVIAIIAVILLQDPNGIIMMTKPFHMVSLVYMVYCGYILITPMHIIGQFMDEEMPKTLEMAWAVIGSIMWLAAAGTLLKAYDDGLPPLTMQKTKDEFLASGIFGVLNGCTFLAEAGFIFKYE